MMCSGKYGPHDLDEVGTVVMANGRETCRACRQVTKRQNKRKARKKSHVRKIRSLMYEYENRALLIKPRIDPKRDRECRRLRREMAHLSELVKQIDHQLESETP